MSEHHLNLILTWLDRTGDVLCRFMNRHLPQRRERTSNWWSAWVWPFLSQVQQEGLKNSIEKTRVKELPKKGELDELDLIALLRVFRKNWDYLKPHLAPEANDYKDGYVCIQPVNDIRNRFSHRKIKDLRPIQKQIIDDLTKIQDFLYIIGTDSGLMLELDREIKTLRETSAPNGTVEAMPTVDAESAPRKPANSLSLSIHLERTLIHAEAIPARPARTENFPLRMMADIKRFLKERGIDQLYQHQAKMFDHVLDGKDVVITTGTASGKTLSFLLPIFQTILGDPDARALFIYPTNALVYDQLLHIEKDLKLLGNTGVRVGRYDGTADAQEKKLTKRYANLILTNPEMVNQGLLAHHGENEAIMENLRFVVLDELHAYHGAFGAHLSNIIRRLNRLCGTRYHHDRFPGRPQYICCTATIGNPVELAELMTGKTDFELIGQDDDGSPQPPRNVYFFNRNHKNTDATESPGRNDDSSEAPAFSGSFHTAPLSSTPVGQAVSA